MKRAVFAVVAAVLVVACGSDDEGADSTTTTGDTTADTRPEPDADSAVFRSKEVGFTFRYPRDWASERPAGVLGQVSLAKGEFFNAIKVRKAADRQLQPKHYLDDFQRDFDRRVGEVEKRIEAVGSLDAGVLEFTDEVKRDGDTVEFTSTSYFFAGAGATWQVECVAEPEHRAEVDDACAAALASVELRQRA